MRLLLVDKPNSQQFYQYFHLAFYRTKCNAIIELISMKNTRLHYLLKQQYPSYTCMHKTGVQPTALQK